MKITDWFWTAAMTLIMLCIGVAIGALVYEMWHS